VKDSNRSNFDEKNFDHEGYSKKYNEDDFWSKMTKVIGVVGQEVLEHALRLYYTATSPNTPARAKRMAYGALAYFVLPFDFVFDFVPGIGYADDLTILTTTIVALNRHITPEIREQAAKTMASLKRRLGNDDKTVTVERVDKKDYKELPET